MTPSHVAADADELRALVARKVGVLELLHSKAGRAIVNAAQDEAFRSYFQVTTDEERAQQRARIDRIALAVQTQFAVEEMCLIDRQGAEISRIVGRQISEDLSKDEANNTFFKGAFAQEPRTAYVAPIYISPDAHRWVVAYATPIVVQGEKKAILHYEHGLDFYEHTFKQGVDANGARVLLTLTSDGWVIFDSRRDIPIEQVKDNQDPSAYFEKFSLHGLSLDEVKQAMGAKGESGSGTVTAPDGSSFDVAFQTVKGWIVLAFEPRKTPPA